MNLENIMLNEIRQTQKGNYYMIPLYVVPNSETNRTVFIREGVWGDKGSYCLMGTVSVCNAKKNSENG